MGKSDYLRAVPQFVLVLLNDITPAFLVIVTLHTKLTVFERIFDTEQEGVRITRVIVFLDVVTLQMLLLICSL